MLTRLRVSGFKNLVDVDVRFGPFTCVAGPNGVGKSNLFDAIRFLSLLADRPLIAAAQEVRGGRIDGVGSLFHRVGEVARDAMTFEAEMIVPPRAHDDLRQEAAATITFLRYSLTLAHRPAAERVTLGPLEVVHEELRQINQRDAHRHLLFRHSAKKWRSSAVRGERRAPFLSTVGEGEKRAVQLHQDGAGRAGPLRHVAAQLPRTVLSGCGAADSPTALIARREMASWRLLQLEPSALRRPDELTAPRQLGSDGAHLAATLYRLSLSEAQHAHPPRVGVYERIAGRLGELVDDVQSVCVDRDDRRALLTLQVVDAEGTAHPAPAISDGSLRFLAFAVLERDPESGGLICVEEPENGVNPERVPAMIQLLRDIAVDAGRPVDGDNPLRQVIVNTHSPSVVAQVPEDSLLVADWSAAEDDTVGRFRKVDFHPLPDTWRARVPDSPAPVSLDKLLAHLNPLAPTIHAAWRRETRPRRVADREDVQPLLPFGDG